MKNPNLPERHLFTNKMDVNLNMLRVAMLQRVGGHVDSTDIVAKDDGRGVEGSMKLMKKLTEPTTLSYSMGHCAILRLGTGVGDCSLALGRP